MALKPRSTALRLEALEEREVPAVTIQLNYQYDNGFFANNPQARAIMQEVATQMGDSISANLSAIAPSGGNTWTATFYNPLSGAQTSVANMSVAADTIVVFVGAWPISGSEAGSGGFGGYSASGTQTWLNAADGGLERVLGGSGSIAFGSNQNWYFGQSASGLAPTRPTSIPVAQHELGHVLVIGTAAVVGPRFERHVSTALRHERVRWSGAGLRGRRPLGQWDDHQRPASKVMDPILPQGTRVTWTAAGRRRPARYRLGCG